MGIFLPQPPPSCALSDDHQSVSRGSPSPIHNAKVAPSTIRFFPFDRISRCQDRFHGQVGMMSRGPVFQVEKHVLCA
ncbi:hypothetical protein MTP99_011437 [Tenebrio molitor]|nr:hypothetical protein MTP99_011437 [Tenebrio molitor]